MELPWPLHFLKVFCLHHFQGRDIPLLAGFKLTHQCNLRCGHCPFWRTPQPHMDFVQVGRSLEALHQMGVRMVIFEGGEPLLWRDGPLGFNDVAALARPLFLSLGVTTNGTLPLKDVDADTIWVSIDGLGPSHDALRGESFEKILRNIDEAPGKKIYANVTINRRNVSEIGDLVRLLSGRVRGITLQFHYPYGRGEENLAVSCAERESVLEELIALKQSGSPVAVSAACLERLKRNTWTCHDFLLANVEPDGSVHRGCYVKNRGQVDCRACGFAAHTEISLAFDLHPASILAGWKIFGWKLAW